MAGSFQSRSQHPTHYDTPKGTDVIPMDVDRFAGGASAVEDVLDDDGDTGDDEPPSEGEDGAEGNDYPYHYEQRFQRE